MAGAAPPNEAKVEHPFFARFYLRMASGRKRAARTRPPPPAWGRFGAGRSGVQRRNKRRRASAASSIS
jgi:hypothetical protein